MVQKMNSHSMDGCATLIKIWVESAVRWSSVDGLQYSRHDACLGSYVLVVANNCRGCAIRPTTRPITACANEPTNFDSDNAIRILMSVIVVR